jgi:hypothetical protein
MSAVSADVSVANLPSVPVDASLSDVVDSFDIGLLAPHEHRLRQGRAGLQRRQASLAYNGPRVYRPTPGRPAAAEAGAVNVGRAREGLIQRGSLAP